MSSLVRAELLKLRTVALPGWLLLTTLAVVLLGVLLTILTAGSPGAPLQRVASAIVLVARGDAPTVDGL